MLLATVLLTIAAGGAAFAQEPEPNDSPQAAAGSEPAAASQEGEQKQTEPSETVPLRNDAVTFGILMAMLGLVFWTNQLEHPFWKKFYRFVPALLLCYFLPSLLTAARWVNPETSQLYFVASRYLLPTSLVLLTLCIDLREVLRLGPKALVMFVTGTVGVVIGGPIAVLLVRLVAPEVVGGDGADAVWRGLSTVAGSWIGGGANQTAMREIYQPSDPLFSAMVAVDVLVAEFWMMFLLLGVGKSAAIDRFFGADASSVNRLREKMEAESRKTARIPSTTDLMGVLAVAFLCTAASHFMADWLAPWCKTHLAFAAKLSLDSSFFWLIVIATTLGVGLSFTRLRKLEGAGASKIGTVFIFILVATIGLNMDIWAVLKHPALFAVGLIWMAIHVGLLFAVGYWIKAPYFFLAVGSKANIGGAASAPVVAAAFHPSLAPVGVLLAVVGYALGTYGAYLCAILMRAAAP